MMETKKGGRDPSGVGIEQFCGTSTRMSPMPGYRLIMVFVCLLCFLLTAAAVSAEDDAGNHSKSIAAKVNGVVQSVDQNGEIIPISYSTVTLYQAGTEWLHAYALGKARGNANGFFSIAYEPPSDSTAVLYLIAQGSASPVRLVMVLGASPTPGNVVINDRTTVAAAYAMAQFIDGQSIGGKSPGLRNASMTVRNLVDITSGRVGSVLGNPPNGLETSTMPEFNSLANLLSTCSSSGNPNSCSALFELAQPPLGPKPEDTWQAIVNIAHNPGLNAQQLFALSQNSNGYTPALKPTTAPDAWTLAIRYGNTSLLDAPGNIAFDGQGNAWVNNNYVNNPNPELVCGDDHIFKLTPAGADFPGSPFGGPGKNGGLYGSGFGITLDPYGGVWASSFGFQGSECEVGATKRALLSESVSQFKSNGYAVSPSRPPAPLGGWRSPRADISQPQGTVSDQWGNIWIANCGNASVTKLPHGDPTEARNFDKAVFDKPFGIAIDAKGNAWVTNNGNSSVIALAPNGSPIGKPVTGGGIDLPMGIAVDSIGNVWISNSGAVHVPCGGDPDSGRLSPEDANSETGPENASVTLLRLGGGMQSFKGGGIFIPWGIAVDGNDNVWVANFGGPKSGLGGLVQLCGANSQNCPPGHKTGDPISPDTGYTSDGLVRNTGVAIDPSGNVWLANNWVIDALDHLDNPGGHELVVFIGLAAPVQTPLTGPPARP